MQTSWTENFPPRGHDVPFNQQRSNRLHILTPRLGQSVWAGREFQKWQRVVLVGTAQKRFVKSNWLTKRVQEQGRRQPNRFHGYTMKQKFLGWCWRAAQALDTRTPWIRSPKMASHKNAQTIRAKRRNLASKSGLIRGFLGGSRFSGPDL